MKRRVITFAKEVVYATKGAPSSFPGRHLAGQLFRSATSVAANYRAACRARSRKEFIAKIGLVVEEADESLFWLEFAAETGIIAQSQVKSLADEANQLVAILSATRTRTIQNSKSSIPKSLNP